MASDVKWIKIATDIFDDEKIALIESMPDADSLIVIWFKILTLAGKVNTQGVLMINDRIPYTEDMLATIFRRKISQIRLALNVFCDLEMIEIINGVVTIPNWSKHQKLDGIENKKEYMKEYMKSYREKQKLLAQGKSNGKTNSKTNSKTNVNSLDDISNSNSGISIHIFKKPSIEEVEQYCKDRNNKVNPVSFVNFYESKGWMVGKNKMKDWKAAIRTWEQKIDEVSSNVGKKEVKKPEWMDKYLSDLTKMD